MSLQDKDQENFLSRWSRLKREAAANPAEPLKPAAREEPPVLPPVESLTPESDFSAFLHPKVDEKLKRAALKKLFSNPHFNVMDGLDVYVDDYGKPDPIPPDMLKRLNQYLNLVEGGEKKGREKESSRLADAEAPPLPGRSQDPVAQTGAPVEEGRESRSPRDGQSQQAIEKAPLASFSDSGKGGKRR